MNVLTMQSAADKREKKTSTYLLFKPSSAFIESNRKKKPSTITINPILRHTHTHTLFSGTPKAIIIQKHLVQMDEIWKCFYNASFELPEKKWRVKKVCCAQNVELVHINWSENNNKINRQQLWIVFNMDSSISELELVDMHYLLRMFNASNISASQLNDLYCFCIRYEPVSMWILALNVWKSWN